MLLVSSQASPCGPLVYSQPNRVLIGLRILIGAGHEPKALSYRVEGCAQRKRKSRRGLLQGGSLGLSGKPTKTRLSEGLLHHGCGLSLASAITSAS